MGNWHSLLHYFSKSEYVGAPLHLSRLKLVLRKGSGMRFWKTKYCVSWLMRGGVIQCFPPSTKEAPQYNSCEADKCVFQKLFIVYNGICPHAFSDKHYFKAHMKGSFQSKWGFLGTLHDPKMFDFPTAAQSTLSVFANFSSGSSDLKNSKTNHLK